MSERAAMDYAKGYIDGQAVSTKAVAQLLQAGDALAAAVMRIWPSWFEPEMTDSMVAADWEGAWPNGLNLIRAARAWRSARREKVGP